jgi:site-specific DNA-methyltransferase (adenine-specific)
MKPYYEHAGLRIYHGDCRDVLADMPECFSVDAVVTDPPYGVDFVGYASHVDDRDLYEVEIVPRLLEAEARVENGWIAIYQSAARAPDWARFFARDWRPMALPKTFVQINPGKWPIGATDYVLLWQRGKPAWPGKSERVRDWFVQETSNMRTRERGHPCARPLPGVQHVMLHTAPPAGVVLDPFMGSGTTLVAAKNLGRRAIGCDIEERYCEIAAKRLSQEVLPYAG